MHCQTLVESCLHGTNACKTFGSTRCRYLQHTPHTDQEEKQNAESEETRTRGKSKRERVHGSQLVEGASSPDRHYDAWPGKQSSQAKQELLDQHTYMHARSLMGLSAVTAITKRMPASRSMRPIASDLQADNTTKYGRLESPLIFNN
jgi:hypothetical protein